MTVELGFPQLLSDHGFRFFSSPSFPQALIPTPVPESIQIKWETIRDRPVGGSLNFFWGWGEGCSHWLSSYFWDHCLSCPLMQPAYPRDRVTASAFQALLPSALSPSSKVKPQLGSSSKGSWNHDGVFQLAVKNPRQETKCVITLSSLRCMFPVTKKYCDACPWVERNYSAEMWTHHKKSKVSLSISCVFLKRNSRDGQAIVQGSTLARCLFL